MNEKVQQTETGNALQRFLKRKNIIFSAKRYGIDALGAMAQGLFASLLIGTIIGTLGEQIGSQVLVDAGPAIEAFKRDCQPLIKAGAEILLPACSLIACAMRVGIGVEDQYPNGFNEVDGVPVADVIGSALKMSEVLASLKKGGSSWVSRKCTFARPTQLAIDNAKMVTDDIKLKYWDVTM